MKRVLTVILLTGLFTNNFGQVVTSCGTNTNYLTCDGNIGIGTTSPAHKLHVQQDIASLMRCAFYNDASGTYQTDIAIGKSSASNTLFLGVHYLNGTNAFIDNRSQGPLLFKNSGSDLMTLTTSGYLGIGRTPSYQLDVNGHSRVTGYTIGADGSGSIKYLFTHDGGDSYINSGKFGIGTPTPTYKLDVYSSANDNIIRAFTGGAGAWFYAHSNTSKYYGMRLYSSSATLNWTVGSAGYDDFSISNGDGSTNRYFNIKTDGTVLINTTTATYDSRYKLIVNGAIGTTEVYVKASSPWPDYVFGKGYKLLPLKELDHYIEQNKHLPNMPSAEDVKKTGSVNLGEMNGKLLEKVEELTLYIISLEKRISELEKK
jgi:hypothetical protein